MKLMPWPVVSSGSIKIAGMPAAFVAIPSGFGQEAAAIAIGPVIGLATLVFWMNAGFTPAESGICRVKNCVSLLSNNLITRYILKFSGIIRASVEGETEGLDVDKPDNEAYPYFSIVHQ